MRIYKNCKEAISEIQRDLFEMGIEVASSSMQNKIVEGNDDFVTKEIQGYSFMILDHSDKDDITDNLKWCNAEFKERILGWDRIFYTPINPGNAWKKRKEVWSEFLNKDGKFCYTYNERMYWQIADVIVELANKPNTRQAIIEVHDRRIDQYNMGGKKRLPCSMYYQFMYREGKLDVLYTMRSTDFFTHFKNDIWQAIRLCEFMAEQLDVKVGKFVMFAGSLHAYKKDFPDGVY